LKFLKTINIPSNHQNVLKLKINIEEDFDELSTTELKKLQKKFKNISVLIFIAASNDTKFVIYWKSKEIRKFLRLKSFKDNFIENDKCVYEFVVEFLEGALRKGHLGKKSLTVHDNFSKEGVELKFRCQTLIGVVKKEESRLK